MRQATLSMEVGTMYNYLVRIVKAAAFMFALVGALMLALVLLFGSIHYEEEAVYTSSFVEEKANEEGWNRCQ